jgi:hypothetical protein
MILKSRPPLELALNMFTGDWTQKNRQSWYSVTASAEDAARARNAIIQYEFCEIFNAAGDPKDAAMFSSQVLTDGAQLYFSPGAGRIAKSLLERYGGVPCKKPSFKVYLMVGHSAEKEKLFK